MNSLMQGFKGFLSHDTLEVIVSPFTNSGTYTCPYKMLKILEFEHEYFKTEFFTLQYYSITLTLFYL